MAGTCHSGAQIKRKANCCGDWNLLCLRWKTCIGIM